MKLFNRNFIMVLVGQIISLFGNTILRFALPLYLLNKTESASLFGIVSACAFIPMIFTTPIRGIIADRVNKRNIMVALDFSTAFITLAVMLFLGKVNLIVLLLTALVFLYAIQGAYQPAVQSSIPVIVPPDGIMQANSLINVVSSLSGLVGSVIGGMLFGFLGIKPILFVSVICFLISAIIEIFVIILFTPANNKKGMFNIILGDMKESFKFIADDRPEILKGSLIIATFNLVLSAKEYYFDVSRVLFFETSKNGIDAHTTVVDTEDESNVVQKTSFAGTTKYINSEDFKQADLECSFGAMEIYFDKANVKDGKAIVRINGYCAGIKLFIPKSWSVENNIEAFLSGIEQKNKNESDGLTTLILIGETKLSGIEIEFI